LEFKAEEVEGMQGLFEDESTIMHDPDLLEDD